VGIEGRRCSKSSEFNVRIAGVGPMANDLNTTNPEVEEVLKNLNDRLLGWELVEYLEITTEEIIEAFRERVIDVLDELEDEFL